jgi:hypothetical protein
MSDYPIPPRVLDECGFMSSAVCKCAIQNNSSYIQDDELLLSISEPVEATEMPAEEDEEGDEGGVDDALLLMIDDPSEMSLNQSICPHST